MRFLSPLALRSRIRCALFADSFCTSYPLLHRLLLASSFFFTTRSLLVRFGILSYPRFVFLSYPRFAFLSYLLSPCALRNRSRCALAIPASDSFCIPSVLRVPSGASNRFRCVLPYLLEYSLVRSLYPLSFKARTLSFEARTRLCAPYPLNPIRCALPIPLSYPLCAPSLCAPYPYSFEGWGALLLPIPEPYSLMRSLSP